MPDLETTVHHVREYEGGPLAIHGHIYGEPHIRYLLMEDPDSFGITPLANCLVLQPRRNRSASTPTPPCPHHPGTSR